MPEGSGPPDPAVTGVADGATGPPPPFRSRGVIALAEDHCTVCMVCARECPDWCIYIESHTETTPATVEGGRARAAFVLDRFAIDYSLCMYCGICVEVCPFDALFWAPEFEYADTDIVELTHERDRLRGWLSGVPESPSETPSDPPDRPPGNDGPASAVLAT